MGFKGQIRLKRGGRPGPLGLPLVDLAQLPKGLLNFH